MRPFHRGSPLGPYKILPIFYCNKGDRGENILRNIVGNKGGLGGGYCTIICNNAPFSVSRTVFFQTPPPIQNPTTKANKKIPPNTYKHLKTPQNRAGGCNNW